MRFAVIGLAAAALGGCAGGMSKSECLYADWRAIGYEDGARGAPTSAVTSHRQACARKAGLAPDMEAYLTGRESGLKEYCQPSNGFAVGSRGGGYYGVCAGAGEGAFVTAYQRGEQLHALESHVARAESALTAAHADYDALNRRIDAAELALVSPTTPNLERIDILADLKHMQEEKKRLEASFRPLMHEHDMAAAELADYRAFLVAEGPYPGAAQSVTQASY